MGQRQVTYREWVEMMERDHTSETVQGYKGWVIRFEQWAGKEPDKSDLADFDSFLRDGGAVKNYKEKRDDLRGWKYAKPPDGGYSYSARVKALSAAKSWLAFAHDVDFGSAPQDLVNNIAKGDYEAFDPVIAGPDKVGEILESTRECPLDACHPMALLSYDAIMRVSEVVRVRIDDVDLDRGTVYVRASKGSDNRHVQLSPRTVEVLRGYKDLVLDRFEDPKWLFYKFYAHQWNHPFKPRHYSRHFIRHHWDEGHHAFARHSAVTNRLKNGETLTDVNNRARHSSLRMTQKYNQFASNGEEVPPELK